MADLEKSPIYAMSLGSKELFHSNFWAWLMSRYPDFVKTFFPELDITGLRIEREKNHRDITIHTKQNDDIYIIENKIKSLPYVEQLAKYQIEAGKKFKGGVIAAIENPNFDENDYKVKVDKKEYSIHVKRDGSDIYILHITDSNGNSLSNDNSLKWRFVSYNKIIEGIKKLSVSPEHSGVIDEYSKVTQKIIEIIKYKLDDVGNKFLLKCDELHGLKDIYQKYKMSHFKNEFEKRINDEDLSIVQDYSHDANLSIYYTYKYDDKEQRIGIQIEGQQYRRYAELYRKKVEVENLYKTFKEKGWFGKKKIEEEKGKKIFGKPTGMQNEYCMPLSIKN